MALDTKKIIKSCIDDIIVHELFHYIIRSDVSEKDLQLMDSPQLHQDFQHFIAEGLVQTYAEEFSQKHGLNIPKSNYGKNTIFARELLSGFEGTEIVNHYDKNDDLSDLLLLLNKKLTELDLEERSHKTL